MSLHSLLHHLASRLLLRRRKHGSRWSRPLLERLEDRTLLSMTFTVNSTSPGAGGAGVDTLFTAIAKANDHANNPDGPDVIKFAIPGTGKHTISVLALPIVTDPLIIDGTSQDGYAPGQPVIEIDGSQSASPNGLEFQVGGNTVKGLIINSFAE